MAGNFTKHGTPLPTIADLAERNGIPKRSPLTDEQAQKVKQRTANLQEALLLMDGATVSRVEIWEDMATQTTHVVVNTDRGALGFASPFMAICGPGIEPDKEAMS